MWINHLSPDVCRGKWSTGEELFLFEKVGVVGKKWARIAQMMRGSRTEHMVKNKYNTMMRTFRR